MGACSDERKAELLDLRITSTVTIRQSHNAKFCLEKGPVSGLAGIHGIPSMVICRECRQSGYGMMVIHMSIVV